MRLLATALIAAATLCMAAPTMADETVTLTIKDHRFTPDRVDVAAGQKISLIIRNQDSTVEEFESKDLKREKIVAAGKEITVTVGPLKPGEYKFFGEFHEDTAKGVLVAK